MIRRVEASGLEAVRLATDLLHRVRLAHPTVGLWEAADVQWWWRTPRRSDEVAKPFWLDDEGPVASALLTEWREAWGLDPIVVPGAAAPTLAEVVHAGLELARGVDARRIETQVDDGDAARQAVLRDRGFRPTGVAGGVTWMDAARRPLPRSLPEGFEIVDRTNTGDAPHPMAQRNGPEAAARLAEVSLYDPSLDLAIRTSSRKIAGYALFWFDPVTRVGMLEPMRVEDAWQRRGLATGLILEGLARLAARGASRIKVSFETEPAKALYTGLGFEVVTTDRGWVLEVA